MTHELQHTHLSRHLSRHLSPSSLPVIWPQVRTLGDKKFHLVKYLREKATDLLPGTTLPGAAPVDVSDAAAPPVTAAVPPLSIPAPVQMGNAQVLTMPAAPAVDALSQTASLQPASIMQAVATIQQAAPVAGGATPAVLEGVRALEGTLSRLE